MRPWSLQLEGRLEEHTVHSPALQGNPLGDPPDRPLLVYLPPSYDRSPERRYPVVYVLKGYAGSVASWRYAPSAFEATYPEEADALFLGEGSPECILAFVDGWSTLGGSQWIDSSAVGQYGTYLAEDVVGAVDAAFRTLASPAHRGIQGKSSGGYGALVSCLGRPDVFGAFATHAGDGAFSLSMQLLVADAYRALRDGYDGEWGRYWTELAGRRPMSRPTDFVLRECWAMAACYSPAEASAAETGPWPGWRPDLPFDPASGELELSVWSRWLARDPVELLAGPEGKAAARRLRAVWVDAGRSDEHFLDVAADRLSAALHRLGVDHHHELFPGGHRGTDHRYPLALAYLAERLSGSG